MQPCRDRLWKTSPHPCGEPVLTPQAFQGQRARWTLKFLPLCCLLWSQGPQSPVGPSPPPPHQHRFCLPSGPQTCPPLSRSLAPDVTCLPGTASSPLPSPRVCDAAEMQTWPHGCLPDTFKKQGLQGLPHAPWEDLGRWQPHRALLTPSLSPPPHHGSLLPRCQASPCPRPGHSGPGACFSALCLRPRGLSQLPPSSWHLPSAQ